MCVIERESVCYRERVIYSIYKERERECGRESERERESLIYI